MTRSPRAALVPNTSPRAIPMMAPEAFVAVFHDSCGSMASCVTLTSPSEPGTSSQKLGRNNTMRGSVGRASAITHALKAAMKAPAHAPAQAG